VDWRTSATVPARAFLDNPSRGQRDLEAAVSCAWGSDEMPGHGGLMTWLGKGGLMG